MRVGQPRRALDLNPPPMQADAACRSLAPPSGWACSRGTLVRAMAAHRRGLSTGNVGTVGQIAERDSAHLRSPIEPWFDPARDGLFWYRRSSSLGAQRLCFRAAPMRDERPGRI